jgi:uncharacterized protein (DUF433 family)
MVVAMDKLDRRASAGLKRSISSLQDESFSGHSENPEVASAFRRQPFSILVGPGFHGAHWRSVVKSPGERRVTMAALDWSHCPAVESIPGKVSGAWVLRGTRMPVSAIFENLEAGASIDDIMEWFDGLDREQVKAVIEFAARSLDKPPVHAP